MSELFSSTGGITSSLSTVTPLTKLFNGLLLNTTFSNNDGLLGLPFQQEPASTYGSGLQTQNGLPPHQGVYGSTRWNQPVYSNNPYGNGPYGSNPYGHSANPGWSSVSTGEESWNRVFKLVLLSFVSTIGSMGSIFVISSITVIDTFQVRGNCFLASLAFGHLIVTLAVLPASAIAIMANITDDPDLCHFQWILTQCCFIVTVLSFFCLAVDNYFAMNQVVRYQMCCTKCRVFLQLILVWTAAGVFPWVQHHYQWGPEFCADKRNWKINIDFHSYILGFLALITLLTIIFFLRTLFRYNQYKLQLENSSDTGFIISDGYLLQYNSFVYFVSLCMWLPMIVGMVIDPIKPLPQHYLDTVWCIALANSCSFSYMYAATNRDFREAFNKLFYYCCCKSHVTFTRKGAAMRRTMANESMGLRVHIIPGLNIYAQRKETNYTANYGASTSGGYGGTGRAAHGPFGNHPLFHKAGMNRTEL